MAVLMTSQFYMPPALNSTMVTLGVKDVEELLCGAVGGPTVVSLLTPTRNAMTLAAKEPLLGYVGIYRMVFGRGFLGGFRGAFQPAAASALGFSCTGPVYLAAERKMGGNKPAAMLFTAVMESLLTYRAQALNAQQMYNATRTCASQHLQHQPGYVLAGPGFTWHVNRNIMGMVGIRMIAPRITPTIQALPGVSSLPEEGQKIVADFTSSSTAAVVSMFFNHIFSWSVCTPELLRMSYLARGRAQVAWLFGQYQQMGVRLLARDLGIRITNVASIFTGYRVIERRMGVE